MNRLFRYAIALLVGAVVVGGVAFFQPQSAESAILLAGIAVVYTVETAIALRTGRFFEGPRPRVRTGSTARLPVLRRSVV